MWKPNEIIPWRGIYRERIWHAHSTIVVKDSMDEIILALLPGAECIAPKGYLNGKTTLKRRWDYINTEWTLEKFSWQTNRLLILTEPGKYYSTIFFWDNQSNKFLCYYINFQLPIRRNRHGLDTLDLDLDLVINPDLTFEWKDEDDYQKGIETGIILPEWVEGIEHAKKEVLGRLASRGYPFDRSWLNWKPDVNWAPPKFPEIWLDV